MNDGNGDPHGAARAGEIIDAIALVPSDALWLARYDAEADAIRRVLASLEANFQFEHIGSTAVPGLAAKPIIDILLIPPPNTWPRDILVRALGTLGYIFWDANPDPDHLFFVKGMPPFGTGRTHHVHMRPAAQAAPILAFRDQLRRDRAAARAYEELKYTLAERYPTDREAYTRGKDAFIAAMLASIAAPRSTPAPASCT
jgi:GrpB-like predicted nucleotidyltransferase (UPF0157 family)